MIGCDAQPKGSCEANCSGKAPAHLDPRSFHLVASPDPVVGDGLSTHAACAQMWALGPTVVLLQRATHRPRPGGMRPKSKLPVGSAVFLNVWLPTEAAPPRPRANGPQMHANWRNALNSDYLQYVIVVASRVGP